MGRWSDWYHFTEDVVNAVAPDVPGVYEIALDGWIIGYPQGASEIVYIGSSPTRSVSERLIEHIAGRGNTCVYWRYCQYPLLFSFMVSESPYDTEQNALDSFVQTYGDLPECNEQ